MKAWLNSGSIVVDSGKVVLCDSCPCGDVPIGTGTGTGTGTSVAVDLDSGIAVVGDCSCAAAEVISLNVAYEINFSFDVMCPFLWFKIPSSPAGPYRIRANVISLSGLGINYTAHYGSCAALTMMQSQTPINSTGLQCLILNNTSDLPSTQDIFLRLYGLAAGDGAHLVFVVENEVCP